MPVAFARERGLTILPPTLTVLFAQGHIQDPFFAPALVHLGDFGGQGFRLKNLRNSALKAQPAEVARKLSSSANLGMLGGHSYLLDPGPQVRRALIEAGILDEMPFAGRCHLSTVVPVESI